MGEGGEGGGGIGGQDSLNLLLSCVLVERISLVKLFPEGFKVLPHLPAPPSLPIVQNNILSLEIVRKFHFI